MGLRMRTQRNKIKYRRHWCTESQGREWEWLTESMLRYKLSCIHWLWQYIDLIKDLNNGSSIQ